MVDPGEAQVLHVEPLQAPGGLAGGHLATGDGLQQGGDGGLIHSWSRRSYHPARAAPAASDPPSRAAVKWQCSCNVGSQVYCVMARARCLGTDARRRASRLASSAWRGLPLARIRPRRLLAGRRARSEGWGAPDRPHGVPLFADATGVWVRDCEDFEVAMVTTARPPLLCLSHLRWDFVWQRPQHVMSRLARDRQLFFVEEPLFRPEAPPAAEATLRGAPGRRGDGGAARLPRSGAGWGPGAGRDVRPPGGGAGARAGACRRCTAWFYTPMLLPALAGISPGLVVYDAMDELSLFRGAPA